MIKKIVQIHIKLTFTNLFLQTFMQKNNLFFLKAKNIIKGIFITYLKSISFNFFSVRNVNKNKNLAITELIYKK